MGRTACTEPQCLYKGALYLFYYLMSVLCNRDRVVGIVARLDDSKSGCRQGQETLLFSKTSRPPLGSTKPPNQWVPGLRTALF